MSALNLKKFVESNENYRTVISTSPHLQLVAMAVNDNIPKETHTGTDQFIYIVVGQAKVTVGNNAFLLNSGDSITIPAGAEHEVVKTSVDTLKLYTIYSPPHHHYNTINKNKEE